MLLNPNAPEWTPGQGSGGEHREVGGMIARRVGKRQRGGWKRSRPGEPHRSETERYSAGKGKHRVNSCINPRVRRQSEKDEVRYLHIINHHVLRRPSPRNLYCSTWQSPAEKVSAFSQSTVVRERRGSGIFGARGIGVVTPRNCIALCVDATYVAVWTQCRPSWW